MLQLSKNKQIITKDGLPFFLLADTVWSALTNIEERDWVYYLDKRKAQGFNTLQVNLMPQWDRSVNKKIPYPFKVERGYFNIQDKDEEYFTHAERMIEIAVNKGFIPAIVLLWSNYVPGTWAGNLKKTPYFSRRDVKQYTKEMVDRFKKFNPIYLISGDTDFPNENVVNYYYECLEETDNIDPSGLKVLHIKRGLKDIPKKLLEHPALNLYFYQSGHNPYYQSVAYNFADFFYNTLPTKPVINSEPCYELMAYSRNEYGRFSREDVRKVAWQSVFSGAFAGITYGAHGVWSWHDSESKFGSELGEGFAPPYNWRVALEFEGANDYGFLKQFILGEKVTQLAPNQSILLNLTKEIRVAETETKVYIYMPANVPLQLRGTFNSKKDYAIDLENRQNVSINKRILEETTIIEMTAILKDSVLVIHKTEKDEKYETR